MVFGPKPYVEFLSCLRQIRQLTLCLGFVLFKINIEKFRNAVLEVKVS